MADSRGGRAEESFGQLVGYGNHGASAEILGNEKPAGARVQANEFGKLSGYEQRGQLLEAFGRVHIGDAGINGRGGFKANEVSSPIGNVVSVDRIAMEKNQVAGGGIRKRI